MWNFIWHCARLKKINHERFKSNILNINSVSCWWCLLVYYIFSYGTYRCCNIFNAYNVRNNFFRNKQMMWKVTYKFKGPSGWQLGYKTLKANSPEDAIRLADMWPKLIKKVERI